MTIENVPLESRPTDDQKHRLEDWLSELKAICRKYGLILDTEDGELRIIDVRRGTTIGIGLAWLAEGPKITAYDCAGSILDGVWLVDTDDGPVEQRALGMVWPGRP